MDRLLIAQKIYDVSNPEKSNPAMTVLHLSDSEGAIKEVELNDVLKNHFNARFTVTRNAGEFSIVYPRVHEARLREVLNNYWNLVDTNRSVEQPVNTQTKTFIITLPTGVTIEQVEQFLRTHKENAYVVDQVGSKRYQFASYADRFDKIKQLVDFYIGDVDKKEVTTNSSESIGLESIKPLTLHIPLTDVDSNKLSKFLSNKMTEPFKAWTADKMFHVQVNSEKGKTDLNAATTAYGLRRKASAFVQDVKFGNLPKSVQKDVKMFVHGARNDTLLIQYGMVVLELLKKVDPENFKLAKSHMADKENKTLEKEFYDKSDDKYILLVNDRIVDGHHFLAKAEKIGATRTLKVLDLTPARFQKRNAISLTPENDGYHITSFVPSNGDGMPIWFVKDETGRNLKYRGEGQANTPLLWTAKAAEAMLEDYLQNPEMYEWYTTKHAMKHIHAKLLPGFEEVYVGIDEGKHGIEIINVTESPFTHRPRINLFLMDPETHEVSQVGHIDTAGGHETATRLTVIEEQDIHEEIQSLLSQLKNVVIVAYDDWHSTADHLAEELMHHV